MFCCASPPKNCLGECNCSAEFNFKALTRAVLQSEELCSSRQKSGRKSTEIWNPYGRQWEGGISNRRLWHPSLRILNHKTLGRVHTRNKTFANCQFSSPVFSSAIVFHFFGCFYPTGVLTILISHDFNSTGVLKDAVFALLTLNVKTPSLTAWPAYQLTAVCSLHCVECRNVLTFEVIYIPSFFLSCWKHWPAHA